MAGRPFINMELHMTAHIGYFAFSSAKRRLRWTTPDHSAAHQWRHLVEVLRIRRNNKWCQWSPCCGTVTSNVHLGWNGVDMTQTPWPHRYATHKHTQTVLSNKNLHKIACITPRCCLVYRSVCDAAISAENYSAPTLTNCARIQTFRAEVLEFPERPDCCQPNW